MDQSGFAYLYVIAALGMTFATMSAIVVVLRQSAGIPLTPMLRYLTRLYVEYGFLVSGLSLLPMLLAMFNLSPPITWRISSAVFAVLGAAHMAVLPRRYRLVSTNSPPLRVQVNRVVRWLLLLMLVLNATPIFYEPSIGLYGLAATYFLGQICFTFCKRLNDIQDEPAQLHGAPIQSVVSAT